MTDLLATRRVSLGKLYITPIVTDCVPTDEVSWAVVMHAHCDWGEVSEEDWELNDQALENGGRILSVFESTGATRFWIITEADRSATTVLLPLEY